MCVVIQHIPRYDTEDVLTYSTTRGNRWPTAHKCAIDSGGFNTHNYKTQSILLKLEMNLMASHIQRQLTTSQLMFPIFHNINFPKRFTAFRPVEATVDTEVLVAAYENVIATLTEYAIHKERFTQVITSIGRA